MRAEIEEYRVQVSSNSFKVKKLIIDGIVVETPSGVSSIYKNYVGSLVTLHTETAEGISISTKLYEIVVLISEWDKPKELQNIQLISIN